MQHFGRAGAVLPQRLLQRLRRAREGRSKRQSQRQQREGQEEAGSGEAELDGDVWQQGLCYSLRFKADLLPLKKLLSHLTT